jgi:hypothetical protein
LPLTPKLTARIALMIFLFGLSIFCNDSRASDPLIGAGRGQTYRRCASHLHKSSVYLPPQVM